MYADHVDRVPDSSGVHLDRSLEVSDEVVNLGSSGGLKNENAQVYHSRENH